MTKIGLFFPFFRKHFISLLLEREEGRERKTGRETLMCERYIDWLPLSCTPTGDGAYNAGMCPDQEPNQRPSTLWDDAQ